jgi:hypothetical protein
MTEVVGLRFVTAGETEARQSMERYQRAQQQLAVGMQVVVRQSQQQTTSLDRISQATQRAEREIQRLTRANTRGSITSGQFQGELNRVAARLRTMGLDRAQQQVMQYARASQTAARYTQVLAAAQTQNVAAQRGVQAATRQTSDLTGRLRQQFLATANTIAILDGPLGGIASRFSAFGVLLGRTGLLLGATAVAMTALITVAGRGVRAFSQFEVETAKINATLATTRHAAGLTGAEIERMSARIALSTLESEQAMRQAATRLLTFRDVAGEVFEDVLKAATDMAALGFGTVESEATKLAKALEDPAQALTSLSRAGIIFTRQQRAMIISMVEAGDRAGAMERILDNVNRRVGGAAEAAARDTFAGSMDTIGQAAGRAVRDLGRFVVEVTGLGRVVGALADRLADYAAGAEAAEGMLARLREEQTYAVEELARAERRRIVLVGPQRELVANLRQEIQARADAIAQLGEQIAREEALARLRQQTGAVERRREGLENLRAEVDMRARLIGLTEEQQRTQRAFAAEGLLVTQTQVNAAVERYARALRDAGVEQGMVSTLVRAHRVEMEGLQSLMVEYLASLESARTVAEALRTAEGLAEREALQERILILMQQGTEAAEAQRTAQDAVTEAQLRAAIAAAGTNTELVAQLETALENLATLRKQEAAIDAITEAQRVLNDLDDRLKNILEENEVLEMQLQLMDDGIAYTEAIARAEIEVQKARVLTRIETEGITEELREQLALLNAMSDGVTRNVELRDRVAARRPSRAGGGGGGRGREPTDIADTIRQMQEEARRTEELIQLDERRRREMEIFYRLKDANQNADIKMTDERLMRYAQELAASAERVEALRAEEAMAQRLGQAFGSMFLAAANGADAFRQSLSGLLRSLASALANAAFRNMLLGGGGRSFLGAVSGAWGGLMGNANGNAFAGGNVIPFADGGIVDRPTTFPMRGNQTGLMGEAGPEAIMPLKRGRDGKLGVASQSQQVQVDVRVYMDEGGNWKHNVESIADRRVQRHRSQIVSEAVRATYAANSERKMS